MEENNKTMEIETNNMKKHISILTTVFIIVFIMMVAGLVFSNAYWYDRHLKGS